VHRDIKPANILFTLDGTPQIGDLNVARELIGGLAYSQTGTPNYASPEIWDNLSYGA
jgi:NIMA (never in mitosis gene a)-related kinase